MACSKQYRDDKAKRVFHTTEKMPYETEEEFQKRFGKRIVIEEGETITILNPFGKKIKVITLDKDIDNN